MFNNSQSTAKENTELFFHNRIESPALMTYKEAAKYLGVSETHIRRMKHKLKTVNIGIRGVRYVRSSLDQWIKENQS